MISCKHSSCKEDRRKRFCEKQKLSIKKWYKKGWSVTRIAEKFDCSFYTIVGIVDNKRKKYRCSIANKININRYWSDEKFRQKKRQECRNIMRKRYLKDSVYREYKRDQNYEYYHKNKENKS